MDFLYQHWVDIIGYSGSLLVAVSLSMRSISRLRKFNLIGATTFSIYGLLVGAYPVFLLNGYIALIDIYYLAQMRRQKDYFELLPIRTKDSPFLKRFIEFYHEDIQSYFPGFRLDPEEEYIIVFVLRNMLPVNLFVAHKKEESILEICLDYSIPRYRDMKNAHYFYLQEHDLFREGNYRCLVSKSEVPDHIRYLKQMGFRENAGRGKHWFSKEIPARKVFSG